MNPACKHRFATNLSKCSTCNKHSSSNLSSSSSSASSAVKYIYHLPYSVRKSLCEVLDYNFAWRQLGGEYMKLDHTQLELISHAILRNESPTNKLLCELEQGNYTIRHLFRCLFDMKHRRALQLLLPFVDVKLKSLYEQTVDDEEDDRENDFMATTKATRGAPAINFNPDHPHNPFKVKATAPTHSNDKIFNDHWNNLNLCSPFDGSKHSDKSMVCSPSLGGSFLSSYPEDDLEVPYRELQVATDDFSKDKIIGSGGFGDVYRGVWKGTQVAIKRLKGLENVSQAKTELRALSRYRIDNILPLYGISLDGPKPCLLYQYMPNGSLEDRLLCKGNTPPLTWEQRATIGEGIAKALNYLHTFRGRPLVHGDVKSANVLLDAQFQCKLGDFGLAKQIVGDSTSKMVTHLTVASVHGTFVYLPYEYLQKKKLSPAVDVFSYGIVMLEMATGRRAYDGKKLLLELVQEELNAGHTDESRKSACRLMDSRIKLLIEGSFWFNHLIDLGVYCAQKDKVKRPSMSQVLEYYERYKTRDRIRRLSAEYRAEPTAVVQETLPFAFGNEQTTEPKKDEIVIIVPSMQAATAETESRSYVEETRSSTLTDVSNQGETNENLEPLPPLEENVEGMIPLITELGIDGLKESTEATENR